MAIGEWAADAAPEVLVALGIYPDPLTGMVLPPDEATVRRVLAGVDGDGLDAAIGVWLLGLYPAPRPPMTEPPIPRVPWRAVAVEGKTLRGAGRAGGQLHLLAAMDYTTRMVLAQVDVDGKIEPDQPVPAAGWP